MYNFSRNRKIHMENKKHEPITRELITYLNEDPELRELLDMSIAKGSIINPDEDTNPIRKAEDYFDLIDRCVKGLPWTFTPSKKYSSLYMRIDQSMGIMYYVLEQPLDKLKGRGYYHPSLIHHEPISSWFHRLVKQIGNFLDEEGSWSKEYYELALKEEDFHLKEDLYEDPKNWHCFNDFFSRKLKDPSRRPIAFKEDDHVIVSPADAIVQGLWRIDENGRIIEKKEDHQKGLSIKTGTLCDVSVFLGSEGYGRLFAGGTLTHTFLDINEYHRFHFPLSGKILDMKVIPYGAVPGGVITWDEEHRRYKEFFSEVFGWQSLETRGILLMEDVYGHRVAVCPLGMCQVASVNFEKDVCIGKDVKKGDPMGCFRYGGSDIVMIFEKDAGFTLSHEKDKKLLTGEEYGRIRD